MHSISPRRGLAFAAYLTLTILTALRPCPASETQSLAGPWRFHRDEANAGVAARWFAAELPAPASGPAAVRLPGTTDEAKAGVPNPKPPTLDGLYRPNIYTGAAWYQREIDVPASWSGKRLFAVLERNHWETRLWVDDRLIGSQDSLVAPHRYDLGAIAPGKHRVTLRIDNTLKFNLGTFVSIYYEGTQTNWNGTVGRLELEARDPVLVEDVKVYPDIHRKIVKARVRLLNTTGKPIKAGVAFSTEDRQTHEKSALQESAANLEPNATVTLERELPLPNEMKLWDEFSPSLYDLHVNLTAAGDVPSNDSRTVTFGMRDFGVRGTQFTLNGRPIFLRGTLECAIFPKTGYPATDVPSWQRIYQIIKSYGLNHIRFHSWCPPDAAFAAADVEGIIVHAEGPQANVDAGRDHARDAFVEKELMRIVEAYGNHPSFCMMALGNEYGGDNAVLTHWVDMLIKADPRRLYSSASNAPKTDNRQFTVGFFGRGVHSPGTANDVSSSIAHEDRPPVGHEIGQETYFPNFDEMAKYDGVLEPRNFEIVRQSLKSKGMLDLAPRFFEATGRQATLLYKEEIEVLLRTRGFAGLSLLDMHDYPGQGTALIGPLDPFWDSKGFVTPETHRQYYGPTVPLLRMPKRAYTVAETFGGEVDLAHFGPKDLTNVRPLWRIADEKGREVAAGTLANCAALATGTLTRLGAFETPLSRVAAPAKLTVTVSLDGTGFRNSWEIWVYPDSAVPRPPESLTIVNEWNDSAKQALAAGKSVLLFPRAVNPEHALPGKFIPVFWSPVWFPHQKPNTMGILCDPKHPALAAFPTDFYSNWQWWDILNESKALILDETPASFRPIVQVIDNFVRNQKLGSLFEARVGKGRLLVCAMDLQRNVEKRPAARQLLTGLYAYAASPAFDPAVSLEIKTLDAILAPPVSNVGKLNATVVGADSEAYGYEGVNAIDGDPTTIWHTRWKPAPAPLPHWIVLDLGREVELKGVTYLPRQDQSTGRASQCEVYLGNDRTPSGAPCAKAKLRDTGDAQTITFPKPHKGRYLKFVITADHGGKGFISLAELDVVPVAGLK